MSQNKSQNQEKTSDSNLPPLDFTEEVKNFEALSEKKEVKFVKCNHKNAKIKGNKLVCPCGAVWFGPRLQEVLDYLKNKE